MNYAPRYLAWTENRDDIDLDTLPKKLLTLIAAYQSAFRSWENASEKEQTLYRDSIELTDAYLSSQLRVYIGDPPNSDADDDKLKALLSKAADLDF